MGVDNSYTGSGLKNCESLVRKLEGSKFMQDHLKLPLAWQPDTLRKHLSGWKRWSAYCRSCSWNAGNPGLGQFCDYLHIVLEGIDEDRDEPAFGTVAGIISAVRFVADKLDVPCLNDVVRCAAVDGFINAKPATIKREAPPLAAAMVAAMEQAVTQGVLQPFQTLVVGYFLLLVWASLRFGDGRRTRPLEPAGSSVHAAERRVLANKILEKRSAFWCLLLRVDVSPSSVGMDPRVVQHAAVLDPKARTMCS